MASDRWEITIDGRSSGTPIEWRELLAYRDLFASLVGRDFLYKYSQTLLGPAWFLLQPLLTTLAFFVVFSHVGQVATEGVPPVLFYLSGIVLWSYFTQSLDAAGECLRTHGHLMGKIYFPRLLVPLATVVSRLFTVVIQLTLLTTIYAVLAWKGLPASIAPTRLLAYFPLLLLNTGLFSLGIGLWVASLSVRYRDIQNVTSFLFPLWMYFTPIIYPASALPEQWRWIFFLNPMAVNVESLRSGLFGVGTFGGWALPLSWALVLCVLVTGLNAFHRAQRTFIDRI